MSSERGTDLGTSENPIRTEAHDFQQTMFGHVRTARELSLSYVVHSPANMVSLTGTAARHRNYAVDTSGTSSITYLPNERAVQFTVGTANGDRYTYRQNAYNPYNPGCQQRVTFTATFGASVSNVEKRVGYFDANNGLGILQTGSGIFYFVRSFVSGSVVETPYALSGIDATKDNIFAIPFEWLGAGDQQVFVNGTLVLRNEHAGVEAVPYMSTATLPLTAEIRNVGASAGGTLKLFCGKVSSEGADDFDRVAASTSATTTSIGTGGKLMIQIRPASTITLGSIAAQANRALYVPRKVTVSTTNGPMVVKVFLNGTGTGSPSWAATTDDVGMEQDVADTFVGATGKPVGYGAIDTTTGSVEIDLKDQFAFPGRALTTGAFSGQDFLQVVGFARSGTVSSADVIVEWQRI